MKPVQISISDPLDETKAILAQEAQNSDGGLASDIDAGASAGALDFEASQEEEEMEEASMGQIPPLFIVRDRVSGADARAQILPDGGFVVDGYPNRVFSSQELTEQFELVDSQEVMPSLRGKPDMPEEPPALTTSQPPFPPITQPMTNVAGYPEGVVTQALRGLFGGSAMVLKAMGSFLASAASSPGSPMNQGESMASLPPNVEELQREMTALRLQSAREQRAMERILSLEEQLDGCREGFDQLLASPLLQEAQDRVEQGMDPRDFALEMAHGITSEHKELVEQIRHFQQDTQELATQIKQVGMACEKANIDPSETLNKALQFLDEVQSHPVSEIVPDSDDGSVLSLKLRELTETIRQFLQKLFHKVDEAEEESSASVPSM